MTKLNAVDFIAVLAPIAVRVRTEGSPLFPSVRLAQNLLETGGVLHPWNNLGGIKVGGGRPNEFWRGSYVVKGTWEIVGGSRIDMRAQFRAYDSLYDFYRDQDLLFALPRYAAVRRARAPAEQAAALQSSGYATDPRYASKLMTLCKAHKLERFDRVPERTVTKSESEGAGAIIGGGAVVGSGSKIGSGRAIPIFANGKKVADGVLLDSRTWVPARPVGEALGLTIGWNGSAVTAGGRVLATKLIGGSGFVPVRDLIEGGGIALTWDSAAMAVRLTGK